MVPRAYAARHAGQASWRGIARRAGGPLERPRARSTADARARGGSKAYPAASTGVARPAVNHPRIPVGAFVAALLLAAPAAAQLKLPGKPREEAPADQRGSVAAYRTCLECGARNYTHPPSGRTDAQGRALAWCDACKRDTPQDFPAEQPGIPDAGGSRGGNLKLPRVPRAPVAPVGKGLAPRPAPDPAPAAQKPAEPAPRAEGVTPAAQFIFTEAGKARGPDDGIAQRAVESLIALRDDGLAAARVYLFADQGVPVVIAARVLLRAGTGADADLVARRLESKLPISAGPTVLRALVERDPIRATPQLFAALLDHPHATLRSAAERELRRALDPSILPLLAAPLSSSRAETRGLALGLVAAIEGPAATDMILRVLDDPSARVASAAVQALGTRDQEDLDATLVQRAFAQRWILRPGAYALLAILEREDASQRAILSDAHVQPLLEGLSSNDPFRAGVCAAALAGIGFRSQRADVDTWLDGAVVDRLVLALSGKVFHDDYTALTGPALRRLRLLSGETLGPNGPGWVDWWVASRDGFHARRATLSLPPGGEGSLMLRYAPAADAPEIVLFGPELADSAVDLARGAEFVFVTEAQATELAVALAREGLLGPERLPGTYAGGGRGDRTLTVAVPTGSKSFTVGARGREPWFERAVSLATSLFERNRWQLLADPARPVTQLDHWREHAAWWAVDRPIAERDAALRDLALRALAGPDPAARERALAELERVFAAGGASGDALTPLLAALRQEPAPEARVDRIAHLVLAASDASRSEPLMRSVQRLIDTLHEAFGPAAGPAVARALAGLDHELIRRVATDERPAMRAAAAAALGGELSPDDVQTLIALLADRDEGVQCAAAATLGAARVEGARTDLLAHARLGRGAVRCAALRAVGQLGGLFVLDALLLAISDPDADVRLAGVDGLASLGDPSAAQVLVNLLGDASDAPLRGAARGGLLRLGEAALAPLRRVAEQPTGPARREAALTLAELVSPDAVPPLLRLLTENRGDARVAEELVVMTCLDPRGASDPVAAWWVWWEGVRHDDAQAWLRAALERLAIQQPPMGAIEGAGTPAGRQFLLTLLERPEPWLVERGWRELRRTTGSDDLGTLPPRGPARAAWVRTMRERIAGPASR